MLTFRGQKIKENQGFSAHHQAGVGIDVLPLILMQNSTVNATISEPSTEQDRGADTRFISPYFLSRIKPCLTKATHIARQRRANGKKRGVSRTFGEIRIGAFTQAKVVCSRQFAKIAVFDTSKHKACQGKMHCLPLARQPK